MPAATYLQSRLVRAGLVLFVAGSGPLLAVIAASSLGLTRDPNPNPIGLGLLAAVTFWPSLIMVAVGAWRASRHPAASAVRSPVNVTARKATTHVAARSPTASPLLLAARAAAALLGAALLWTGLGGVRRGEGRGAASVVVLGMVALSWSVFGRLPDWYRR